MHPDSRQPVRLEQQDERAMKKVAILTDSTCCLPQQVIEEYGIHTVPIWIVYEGRSYKDGIDITAEQVYDIMRKKEHLPTTSAPSVGDFLEAYRKLATEAQSILCITMTSLQSQINQVASLARDIARLDNRCITIEVLDSRAVAGALGFVVLEAARTASQGADLAQVIDAALRMMNRVHFVAMVDTLYYLARTGRIGRAAAWVGSLLNVKPVLEHSPKVGETMPLARPKTKEGAIQLILDTMAARVGDAKVHAIVNHADERQEAERLLDTIAAKFDCAELYLADLTPGMGVHAGPGVVGAAFYTEGQ